MPNERSTEANFESEILDEKSGLMCRVSIEAWERDAGKICLEYVSRGGTAGFVQFGMVDREGLVELLKAVKDPAADAVTAQLSIDYHDLEEDEVNTAETQVSIPLSGRFNHRDFLLKFLPIILTVMEGLPARPAAIDGPVQTMATPPAAKN